MGKRWQSQIHISGHYQRAHRFRGERGCRFYQYRLTRGFCAAMVQSLHHRLAGGRRSPFIAVPHVRRATEAIVRLIEG
jgi:hypothetical protein